MAASGSASDILASLALFANVPADEVAAVAAAARSRRFPRGQVIFYAGDAGDSLLVVVSGRVKIMVSSTDGGELVLSILGPGDSLGELTVVDRGDRSADAEALDATEVLMIPGSVIRDLQRRAPVVSENLLTAIAASLRRLTDSTADLVFLDLPRRVGKALLQRPRDAAGVVDLGMSQEQLSHMVGGTRQSVNQAIKGFERRGWIATTGRQIVVTDPAGLARFAGE